jgi:sulfide:quinone oxidoreductase
MATLARMGYRSIVCVRPDGEDAGQPTFGKIKAAAKAAGMEARHIPVNPGMVYDSDAEAFGRAMHELPGPVAAYCRSGMRASSLWSRAAAMDPALAEKFGVATAQTSSAGLFAGLQWLRQGLLNGGRA